MLLASSARATFFDTTWDREAYRWQTNVVASGGQLSTNAYITGTRFLNHVKQWGVRPLLGRVNLYLGTNTNAMLCPIIVDWFNTAVDDDLIAFASGDYSEATGLTGNTTTKYLRPSKGNGLGLASFTSIDNVHMAVYVRTGSDESSYACGYASAGNVTCGMPISFAGNTYIEISLANDPVADSSGVGFYLSTRLISGGTTNRVTYKNGTSIVSSAVNTGNLGSGAFVVHAFNSAGVITAWTSRAQSYYAVGFGIPVAKVAPYRVAVRTVQQAMARNVE